MANIQQDIRNAIQAKLTGTSTAFRTAITTSTGVHRLFFNEAQQGAILPYVVHDLTPITEERDSASTWVNSTLQFLVCSSTLSDCENIAQYLRDIMDDLDAGLTMTGRTTLQITHDIQRYNGKIDNVHNMIVQYKLTVQ